MNSHDDFLSYLQNSTANSAHLAAHFCPALVCPQKANMRIQFSSIFLGSPHQVDMKNIVKFSKHFFCVFQYSRNSQCLVYFLDFIVENAIAAIFLLNLLQNGCVFIIQLMVCNSISRLRFNPFFLKLQLLLEKM